MEHSLFLGDHFLPAAKIKIWRGKYIDAFMLLFHGVVKECSNNDTKELEKIKCRQLYHLHGCVAGAACKHPALVKYQDLTHRVYKEYSGIAWLRYVDQFSDSGSLDPLLPRIENSISSGLSV